MLAAALILLGIILVIYGAGELPETGFGAIALILGGILAANDQMKTTG